MAEEVGIHLLNIKRLLRGNFLFLWRSVTIDDKFSMNQVDIICFCFNIQLILISCLKFIFFKKHVNNNYFFSLKKIISTSDITWVNKLVLSVKLVVY
jgi:hypothetical protein